jgi:hypothetical protein
VGFRYDRQFRCRVACGLPGGAGRDGHLREWMERSRSFSAARQGRHCGVRRPAGIESPALENEADRLLVANECDVRDSELGEVMKRLGA